MTEKKSFGVALLVWFFLGGLGGHRIYIREKVHFLFWYWLVVACTFGIVLLIDLFLIKGMVAEENRKAERERKIDAL